MAPAIPKKEQEPQGPVDPEEAANTTKGLIGGFSGVKTFTAATGTVYGIIAEGKGLALAIAPKIAPTNGFVGIYTRVRVQKQEDWANLEEGGELFGFPEVTKKGSNHSSCEAFVAVALQPTTPFVVGKLVEANSILESLVAQIQKRVEAAGQKLAISPESFVMYLKNVFETMLPTEEPAGIDEFPVCIGDKAISNHLQALFNQFGKGGSKKPKQSENPPGGGGQNPD
jgi:hypothetical protein